MWQTLRQKTKNTILRAIAIITIEFNTLEYPPTVKRVSKLAARSIMKNLRNVIFLDIDGVIQPHGNNSRFKHDLVKLKKELAIKYNNDEYLEMESFEYFNKKSRLDRE